MWANLPMEISKSCHFFFNFPWLPGTFLPSGELLSAIQLMSYIWLLRLRKKKIHVFDARKMNVYHLGGMIPAYSSQSVDQGVNSQNSPRCYLRLSQIALPLSSGISKFADHHTREPEWTSLSAWCLTDVPFHSQMIASDGSLMDFLTLSKHLDTPLESPG